ncbi:rare lipoprotein A-like protein [Synechococcus phage S-CBWM1]|uniref:Rare lipoprotein A-like protein n=1 Tax=Synechococcus phage S-CBWM1 TaxID=2053653 RepID=A0A3G1L3K0_9CAUD|nr:lipoprotein precursor [Synechococcus phage S-CBWM1]ATW62720.1 rare lipoprotein A-like protein [Synechococcus phage S-CBWM1]
MFRINMVRAFATILLLPSSAAAAATIERELPLFPSENDASRIERFLPKESNLGVRMAYTNTTRASWYGPGFYGNRTANGEIYSGTGMTAAHKYLPFGTRLRVTNHRNGRSVVVRINDRGPYVSGRGIDLSERAARALGISGVDTVTLTKVN